MRLIDADALIENFEKAKEGSGLQDTIFLCGAQAVVDSMPTIEKPNCYDCKVTNNYDCGDCKGG